MNKVKILVLTILLSNISYGQTIQDAIKNTDNERYLYASSLYKKVISDESTKGENYYHYGNSLYKNEKIDSAQIIWSKGIEIDEKYALNYVGLGKIELSKGNKTKAEELFTKAQSLNKKPQANVLKGIGEAYAYGDYKNLDLAITYLEKSIALKASDEETYLILGDVLYQKTPENASNAVKNYNKALEINPKSPKGIVKKGIIYKNAKNAQEANKLFQEAVAIDPTYAPAYREIAQLNMLYNNAPRAIENWKKYLELNNDDDARYMYASSLFEGKQYQETINELEALQKRGFNNFYVDRILGYSYLENTNFTGNLEAYKTGLEYLNKFFKAVPKDKIIGQDFSTKANLYLKLGDKTNAEVAYKEGLDFLKNNNVIKKNDQLAGVYSDLIKFYTAEKNDSLLIDAFEYKKSLSELSVQEYYELGRAYYFGTKNYVKSEETFRQLAEKSPNYPVAYIWIARSQYSMDTKGEYLAKDSFLKFFEVITEQDRLSAPYKGMVIEAGYYLGDYFEKQKDAENAKKYWGYVKEVSPTDAKATKFFSSPLGK